MKTDDFLKFVKDNWTVVYATGWTGVLCLVAVVGVVWRFAAGFYKERIATLKENVSTLESRIDGKDEQIYKYRERLKIVQETKTRLGRLSNSELGSQANELSRHLREKHLTYDRKSRELYEDRSGDWATERAKGNQLSVELLHEYERHKTRAIALKDELLSRLPDFAKSRDKFDWLFEHPTHPNGVKAVVDSLDHLALLLPDGETTTPI